MEGWHPVEDVVRWGSGRPERDVPGPITARPDDPWGYLAQPERRTMIGTALDLGWTLWAYEDQIRITPETDRAWLLSLEYTNMRVGWNFRELTGTLRPEDGA